MNTIECFTVTMIIALKLFPYENNAVVLPDNCTTSIEDIQYKVDVRRSSGTIYLKKCSDNSFVSPLNDIPLNTGQQGVFRAVIVRPKQSSKRMILSMFSIMNPIMSDEYRGNLLTTVLEWNYGALTQTWENGSVIDPITNLNGDNKILDVIVFSEYAYNYGSVVNVKIVGAYPIIISKTSTSNWKMIAIDALDQRAARVNNIEDFNREFPDLSIKIKKWLENFNINYSEPYNQVSTVIDAPIAVQVVKDKHILWKEWQESENYVADVSGNNTTLGNKWTLDTFSCTI